MALFSIFSSTRALLAHILGFATVLGLSGLANPAAHAAALVSTTAELKSALATANAGGEPEILLADGVYHLDVPTLLISADGVTIRGASGRREQVVLQGQDGMLGGNIEFIFNIQAANVTIADLSMEDVGSHAVKIDGEFGANNATVRNCVFRDTWEQMLKATPANSDSETWFAENGLVENCLFEYTAGIGPQYYIGGIDVHAGKDWIVRGCVFKNIRSPDMGTHAEHAIHFWSWSRGTLVENNLIINCDRGVGYGLGSSGHVGGVIRNNVIYHADLGEIGVEDMGDVGIGVEHSANTQICHNTVHFEHDYWAAIEYRWSDSTGLLVANNLCNKSIAQRDGASATLAGNIATAEAAWYVSVDPAGPLRRLLRLVRGSPAVDQGSTLGLPTNLTDIDGQRRPFGPAPDSGADEWRPVSNAWPLLLSGE